MCWIRCNGLINGLLGYFEWDRSETIFGDFSEKFLSSKLKTKSTVRKVRNSGTSKCKVEARGHRASYVRNVEMYTQKTMFVEEDRREKYMMKCCRRIYCVVVLLIIVF